MTEITFDIGQSLAGIIRTQQDLFKHAHGFYISHINAWLRILSPLNQEFLHPSRRPKQGFFDIRPFWHHFKCPV
jgi:hypothetical protein